jgi:hypothetical protein
MSELPEGVASAMFLRDGWPRAVVCKVVMKNGCVGIGLVRYPYKTPSVEEADAAALSIAMAHVAHEPPDYTEVLEHMAQMAARAQVAAGGS